MKKVRILILVGLALGCIASLRSTTCMAAEQVNPITLRWTSPLPATSWQAKQHQWYADELEKRTGGRVKLQIYWSESLIKVKDALPALQNRSVDMAHLPGSYYPNNFPLLMMCDGVFNSREDYAAAILALVETAENEPNVRAEIAREKLVPIIPWHGGASQIGLKQCVNSVNDLKGKSIRTLGGLKAEFYKQLGATPVFVSAPEVKEALDGGKVEVAGDLSIASAFMFKVVDVVKCFYMVYSGAPLTAFVHMNVDVFKSLPQDVQNMIPKLRREFGVRFAEGLMEYEAGLYRECETKYGLTRKYPTPEDQKILFEAGRKANEAFVQQQESAGRPAAGKVFSFFMNALKRYEDERAKKK
jgi:TRAP-type transport system periplasmic protein